MYGPGEGPGKHRWYFDPEIPFRAELSSGSEFDHDYIDFQTLAQPPDGNFFLIDITLPGGIQTKEPLNKILDESGVSFPNQFDIEFNQSHIDGGGIEALSSEAELTEFETEVARLMIAHYVEKHAERLGYDFSVQMKWGVVNAIAVMLATELANATEENDD
ncbi:hypothetical protein SAMN05192554_1357 [Haloarchaeobius iranensis]|uniref:Uncharacterized protein n=2 Tax=Haloarchaeobius iranensis TaxID=996166 RepID=A0A1H0B904_9EURY|nr:hypothetical protein SAMN05192554_1357 [Haloarchaeobius iranensis]